jgi:hypothetical protein
VKDLDGDLPGKARVIGQEDLAASAFCDGADDSVRPLKNRSRREFRKRDVSFGVHLAAYAGAAVVPGGVVGPSTGMAVGERSQRGRPRALEVWFS